MHAIGMFDRRCPHTKTGVRPSGVVVFQSVFDSAIVTSANHYIIYDLLCLDRRIAREYNSTNSAIIIHFESN